MTYEDAINWLKKAQDLSPDDGISAYYDAHLGLWFPSYPEVSGYCIPTLIEAGEEDRALRVSRWLRRKQLVNGSIPMGYWNSNVSMVFDTGMALLGWIRAQEVEYDARTQESIDKAVQFLEAQWQEGVGNYLPSHLVRVCWPLQLVGSKEVPFMLDFYEEQLNDNDWPKHCEDGEPDNPLSHFIVYVGRAFYETGREDVARRIASRMGAVPEGRYNSDWESGADFICIPAVSQAAILFEKLGMKKKAQRGRNYLQTLSAPWSTDPIESSYLPHAQLSWSAKFIADALRPIV
jgi:hypothetical protein